MKIPQLRHSTVVAYLALFVALGGSAYAVSKIRTNDLRRGAVTSQKIKNRTITAQDVKPLVLREQKRAVPAGSVGVASVVSRCKKHETFVAGGGGWVGDGNVTSGIAAGETGRASPTGYEIRGTNPDGSADTLLAQAVCLAR